MDRYEYNNSQDKQDVPHFSQMGRQIAGSNGAILL